MADIRIRLKNWWQWKNTLVQEQDIPVSQDMLHLFRLRREHRLLRLCFSGIKQDFQSLLLEVDLKQGRLLLDEPFPHLPEGEYLAARTVSVASVEGAASTRFESRIQGLVPYHDANALVLALPASVTAAQRRNHFRLPVLDHMPVKAMLRLENQRTHSAQVLDLSSQGVRLMVHSRVDLLPGQTTTLLLRIGDENGMLCSLRICNCQPIKNATLLGGELLGLNPPQIQLIERFIARTQRIQRQREMALAY